MSRPESTPNPGVQFPIGAVLQYSNTPSLRVAGFEDEDDDEDENEAPCEWRPTVLFWAWCVDWVSRANIANLDCTNTVAPAQRLGRHFQGVFWVRVTQG
jgi:hypothetical protein